MNLTLPTRHQIAVAGTHAVVGASGFVAAMAYFGVLSPSQVQEATSDIHRIASDLSDLYAAVASLVGIAITAYAAVKSGPLASLLRAAHDIAANPSKADGMKDATLEQKAALVAVTDKLPEVASIATTPNTSGKMLAEEVPSPTVAVLKLLLVAVLLTSFLQVGVARAAEHRPTPEMVAANFDPLATLKSQLDETKAKLDQANAKVATLIKPSGSTDALPCMDISVLTKLTPLNLGPTIKGCEQEGIQKLVNGTQRALDSAKAFTGSATGNTAIGDQDGINCLAPALALFKAGLNPPPTATTTTAPTAAEAPVTTPVTTTDTIMSQPDLIYLMQKYREFTLVGGLTSCQNWFNGPVNATLAAAAGGAGVVAGATLILPK